MHSFQLMRNSNLESFPEGSQTLREQKPNESTNSIGLGKSRKISIASYRTAATVEDSKCSYKDLKSCKICLAEIAAPDVQKQKLISPCLCTGSMKFVHQQCLKSWLNSIVERNLQNQSNTYRISCQICKDPYSYEIDHKLECASKAQVKARARVKKLFLAISAIFVILCLAGIGVLAFLTFTGIIHTKEENPQINYSIFIAFALVLFILLVVWCIALAWIFLIKRKGFVEKIKQRKERRASFNRRNSGSLSGY